MSKTQRVRVNRCNLRWDGRSGYANVGKRCWVGASGAHQSVVHKWCRPRIPHPSSRCVYIKCIIFCSYTYIIYAYFNLRMRRKSVVGCRSSHHRELPSVRPPVMTDAGSSSQMPSDSRIPEPLRKSTVFAFIYYVSKGCCSL